MVRRKTIGTAIAATTASRAARGDNGTRPEAVGCGALTTDSGTVGEEESMEAKEVCANARVKDESQHDGYLANNFFVM